MVPFNIFLQSNFQRYCLGLLELKPGTILFARPLREDGIYLEENDIVESWCLDGYVDRSFSQGKFLKQFQPQISVGGRPDIVRRCSRFISWTFRGDVIIRTRI